MPVKLRQIAHSRAGDKGDDSHVSLIVFDRRHFETVRSQVTAERVRAWFGPLVAGPVERYELPQLGALNFVLRGLLGTGGVAASTRFDPQAKALGELLRSRVADIPARLL